MVRRYTLDKFKDIIPFYNNVEYKKSDPPAYIFKLLQLQIEKIAYFIQILLLIEKI